MQNAETGIAGPIIQGRACSLSQLGDDAQHNHSFAMHVETEYSPVHCHGAADSDDVVGRGHQRGAFKFVFAAKSSPDLHTRGSGDVAHFAPSRTASMPEEVETSRCVVRCTAICTSSGDPGWCAPMPFLAHAARSLKHSWQVGCKPAAGDAVPAAR